MFSSLFLESFAYTFKLTIVLLIDQPIRNILHRPDTSECIAKWAIEFSMFDIKYQSRLSIKALVLADFLVECTIPNEPVELEAMEPSEILLNTPPSPNDACEIYMDGSSNLEGSGMRVVIASPEGIIAEHDLHLEFLVTNNEAKYKALLAGLGIAKELAVQDLKVYSDS